MTMSEEGKIKLKVPENASLQDIISLLNIIGIECKPHGVDSNESKWLYDHKEWIIDGQ